MSAGSSTTFHKQGLSQAFLAFTAVNATYVSGKTMNLKNKEHNAFELFLKEVNDFVAHRGKYIKFNEQGWDITEENLLQHKNAPITVSPSETVRKHYAPYPLNS